MKYQKVVFHIFAKNVQIRNEREKKDNFTVDNHTVFELLYAQI